jgi:hypothetical protein
MAAGLEGMLVSRSANCRLAYTAPSGSLTADSFNLLLGRHRALRAALVETRHRLPRTRSDQRFSPGQCAVGGVVHVGAEVGVAAGGRATSTKPRAVARWRVHRGLRRVVGDRVAVGICQTRRRKNKTNATTTKMSTTVPSPIYMDREIPK